MCIVKPEGPPQLCKTDEIGEIVINSRAGGTMYYGLPGVTKNTFEVCQRLKFIWFSSYVQLPILKIFQFKYFVLFKKKCILKPSLDSNVVESVNGAHLLSISETGRHISAFRKWIEA